LTRLSTKASIAGEPGSTEPADQVTKAKLEVQVFELR
jgi:hypothetical protein